MRAGLIGEASKNIERVAPEFVDVHPELPLAFAYDMRNLFRMVTVGLM